MEVIDTKSKEQETLMHGVREQGQCFWNWDRSPEKRSPSSQSALLAPVAMIYMCDFPGGLASKASVYNAEDLGSSPGLGRSSGEGNGNPLQYYCLENPMDRGAW